MGDLHQFSGPVDMTGAGIHFNELSLRFFLSKFIFFNVPVRLLMMMDHLFHILSALCNAASLRKYIAEELFDMTIKMTLQKSHLFICNAYMSNTIGEERRVFILNIINSISFQY